MSGLFSHSPAPGGVPDSRADITAQVMVPAPGEHAWAGFTEHLHLWWPADRLSRWGESSFFDLENNALVETSAEDDEYVWGEVVDGAAGEFLELRWRHTGSTSATSVRVELRADAAGPDLSTRTQGQETGRLIGSTLTLVHGGWSTEDAPEMYTYYQDLWPEALARYRRFMGGS